MELASERGTIGWSTDDRAAARDDDGISPLPITGPALADGAVSGGVRMLGVDTLPAPNPMFRRVFEAPSSPRQAQLAAVVLGTGVAFVNGHQVGDEALEPAVTDYDKTILYRIWDVRHLITKGQNEIMIMAGRERYAARGGDVWGWNLAPWHREPVALLNLDIAYPDGELETVYSDGTWSTAPGPVEAERLFHGEDWVLRAAAPEWEPATVVAPPRGSLRRATHPPVRASAPLAPRATEALDAARTVYDFGEVMVGRVRCRVSGKPDRGSA